MASFSATSLSILRAPPRNHIFMKEKFFLPVVYHSSDRTNFIFPHLQFPSLSVVCSARRRNSSSNSASLPPKKGKKKKQNSHHKGAEEDEDAFEALFRQLEEDLKNDDLSVDDFDDDISEEELAKLEKELEEALKDDELLGALESLENEPKEEEEEEEGKADDEINNVYEDHNFTEEDYEDDDEEEQETPMQLKNWQLKRLAYALKTGRRKTNIKNLAAELCLDRALILQLLRDPPPNLLMMSAALPDKPVSTVVESVNEPSERISLEMTGMTQNSETKTKMPVHVMQNNWSAQKRIKKVQLETLERVYGRTKRPTNAMISSIVHVTNLPRRRVLKWFEDRREEEGVPEQRLPYQRPSHTLT